MPTAGPERPPVVFINGLWLHSSSWQRWINHFHDSGYLAVAPGWPGESSTVIETRSNRRLMNNVGLDTITSHYADLIATYPVKPIVVGHSFGGLIAQKLLSQGVASAAIAIDPAPIKGVNPFRWSLLRSVLPGLNPLLLRRTVSLTRRQFRYAFGNNLAQAESDELWREWVIPGPVRPVLEDGLANFIPRSPATVDTSATRGPLLLVSGTADHTIPLRVTKTTHAKYARGPSTTEMLQFTGRGHSLTIDKHWQDIADAILNWLEHNT